MLIKLDDAERVVHATIFDLCMKDKNTCAGDYSAYSLEALRALPVSDGVTDEMVEVAREKLKVFVGMSVLFPSDEAIRAALDAALGPLPAPPTIE